MTEPSQNSPSLSPLKRAFLAIGELQAKLAAVQNAATEPIAIIGLGCRFPGNATTPAAFWELLRAGRDAVIEVPAARWPVGAFFDADPAVPGKMAARHGGFLDDVESFDPAYFGISPREAVSMDPQHRLLLEVAWEALSAAGQRRERLAENPTGVFVGITTAEFGQLQLAAEGLAALDAYHITGNALNAAAGRIAFVFGLHGPCMAVDTACSSSLVALHLACQSLRAGECETALAGGVNLILSPLGSIALSQGRVLSADGRAKTFDAAADGMVRGEGCGLLVLKRLSAAQRDGDRVLAVVRGSGVNQDGPSSGLTVPNGPAQEALMRRVLEVARVDPATVDYVEAHGTGTALGDPIEVGALGAVYGAGRATDRPFWLGSVKTNVGHLESAAGIAGVIKAVLALHHEAIPPHLHFTKPSPHIDWANLPVRVPTTLQPWRRGARTRRAAVSAFGFSGTNAHVLLEEAPETGAVAADDPRGLVAPSSPFHRERFPLPRSASYGALPSAPELHPLLGREVALAGTDERRFEATLAAFAPAWLADHRVFGNVVVPATAWLEIAQAVGRAAGGEFAVRDFSIEQALVLEASSAQLLQTVVKADGRVEMFARHEDGWRRHATAQIAREATPRNARGDLAAARGRCGTTITLEEIHQTYASHGLAYGAAFRAIAGLWRGDGEVVAEIVLPHAAGTGAYALHPVLLDACFQAAGAAFSGAEGVFLPVRAARWSLSGTPGDHLWCHARVRTAAEGAAVDFTLFDAAGSVVAELEDLMLQRATPEALQRAVRRGGDWLYEIAWPVARGAVAQAALSGEWLVVDDRGGVAARLRTAGAQVTAVEAGTLAETLARRSAWRGVVCARALEFEPLLALSRGLAQAESVWLVTRGAVAVGGEAVAPPAAAVWGLGRVLMQEHPEWALRLLDVDDASAAGAILGECLATDTENQTAWRAGVRHAARLRRLEVPAAPTPALRAKATYLVTGGLGALGLLAAGWLVRRGARHLVLVGRRSPSVEAQAQIAQWTAAGVRVETRTVDVAQRDAVAALLAALPALRGVVHAAGATADGAARQLTPEQFARVFTPKADGARHLDELAGELDFFILFSSTAAVFGTPGQANYAAANAYLDGLAAARRARGQPALSVNWGGWSVGLAAGLGDRYAARGIGAITPARGFAELERLLAANVAQAVVLPVTWKTFFAALPGGRAPALLTELVPADRATGEDAIAAFRARWAATPGTERAATINGLVRAEVARVLRLAPEKLDPTQPFSALGFDSMMAVDVRNRLRLATDVDVPLVALLESGTVTAIAQMILKHSVIFPGGRRPPGDGGLREGEQSAQTAPGGRGPPPRAASELSTGQEALWFLHQAAPDSAAYNTAVALRLRGPLEREKLHRIFAALAARHPLLRTSFTLEQGRPAMRLAAAAPEWREIDAVGWSDERLAREVAAEYQRPFRLGSGPVFRATCFAVAADDNVLLLGVHHIVGDAWTNWVLLDELRQLLAGATTLPPVAGTYADFVRWQRELLASAEGERLWSFWQRELAGELTPLALPTDFPRPAVLPSQGASAPLAFDAGGWEKIRAVARAHGTTPFAVLLATFQVLLHRHTGQEEVIVGSPTSGRSRPEFAGMVGYFVNPVPLRARLAGRPTFAEFLAQMKRTVLGALDHADFPLPLLVERLKLPRDPSRPALFQSLFVFQQPPQTDACGDALKANASGRDAWGGLDVAEFPLAQMEGQFELALEIFEDRGGSLKYNTALFTPGTAAQFAARFRTLLNAILADPAQRIDDLPLMDATERLRVVQTWNDTPADYPQQFCLHELIAQQAARTPDAPALAFEGETLSYRQLDERANQLAHWLQRAGVRPDTLVGVCAERSLELVIALLGILKAGGSYVPLDPAYPRERLAFMTEDSAVALVLTQKKFADDLRAAGVRTLRLDADWAEVARESAAVPVSGVTPDRLAYLIYTSGSTGRPKGAMNTHRAIVNRLLWMQDAYRLTAADTVVQKTPFSFDVSVWEFFWPLLAGARLVVAQPGGHQDAAYLADLVARERVTTMHFVPSMLQVFVEQPALARCTALRQVFCSGEALPFELQERFFARHHAELHNLYGPTEAAVDVTFWKCERTTARRLVPIGRPIARTQMHVLDGRLQPVPVGVAGELHIGGSGLARGYHRRPELTAEKFIPDPFGAPGARLYQTGDLARWLPDGVLEYLGRLDHQVKLRGFRIELGEIETALAREPGVREATVIMREDRPGEKAVVAYLVAANGATLSPADLRRALRTSLPDYMVPSDFVVLPALPLSPNGKVDRRALPAPTRDHVETGVRFVAPESATEQLLATVWREVLGRDRLGVEDNFFDLGGHSLKLGQVHTQLQTRFPHRPALLELFQYPTIRLLAARLDGPTKGEAKSAPAAAAPAVVAPKREALTDQRALRRAAREAKAVR